ncbi:anthranilate synthase component I family protein [Streptomyces sp. TRM68367]|uniref:anthranilate synthase component I family protein n=1 Tax=Streptomyces sp. TRM68367 TaxID=2758415 RepID=UPI00165B67F5|nr:anthranilate synthase component I family protein [Streptomyces sp. TRM68367]MBC9727096.1 anthranilate synthase component I family protein [Streptomyces sp. TRM68367]
MHTSVRTPGHDPLLVPFAVRVVEARLPHHSPLDLHALLRRELGAREVFLFESLGGPDEQRGPTVLGVGRLAEIRVHARHVEIDGPAALTEAVARCATDAGLTAEPPGGDGILRFALDGRDRVWRFLEAVPGLFAVDTAVPSSSYAFGFLTTVAYEAARHMEELPFGDGTAGVPDLALTLFRDTVRYAEGSDGVRLLRAEFPDGPLLPPSHPLDLVALAEQAAAARPTDVPEAPRPRAVRDSVRRETFLERARTCLDHIGVGDIYQIQIGHRIEVDSALTPTDVYRRLRRRNPSPYMYLLPCGDGELIGASPELFFRIAGDRITMRPIAGTTRRGHSAEDDERRIKEMLASSKEQAEHIMLVDLCRNDIGRVTRPGTLPVDRLMTVEGFSHVFHLVSTVTGRLEPAATVWDALRATFPAGTMSGAPKLRAMEIIHELEGAPRGSYAGAVGLVDVRGWAELALCIRTIVYDGRTYATQSSAGIVAESRPEAEWDETLAKMGSAYWALTGEELVDDGRNGVCAASGERPA